MIVFLHPVNIALRVAAQWSGQIRKIPINVHR